jgi:hypothetical protein
MSFLSRSSGPDRQDRRERLVVLTQRLAEGHAPLARAQVAADRRRGARKALGDLAELLADLVAGERPRLGGLGERTRARARGSDLIDGTVVSIASAICS